MTAKKLPLDLKIEIFRWGPVPGKFFFLSAFMVANYQEFKKRYAGNNWSRTLFLFENNRMFFLSEHPSLRQAGRKVFLRYMLPKKSRARIYKDWRGYVKDLIKQEKDITSVKLKNLNKGELLKLWQKFNKIYVDFWTTGLVPELANYGADKLLEEELRKHVEDETDLLSALEVLAAPEKPSFYQEEEIALAKAKNLEKHREKYFWLKNSYNGTHVLKKDFFEKRKKKIKKNIEQEILKQIKKVQDKKKSFKNKYHLPGKIMDMAKAISQGIEWQDERKGHIFITLHYQNVMLSEIARRFNYSKNDLYNAWHQEITKILKGQNLHQTLKKRRTGIGADYYKSCKNLSPKEVKYYWRIYSEDKIDKHTKEAKGVVVSKGKEEVTRGRVHILLDPGKAESFKKGEILFAPMTSPEYIFAIRKSAAIVTDTGGLTCHAAIVSRELNIPCIVSTKIATKIFKDGEEVEVDVKNGVVRKV